MRADAPAITGMVVLPGHGRTFGFGCLELKVGADVGGQFGILEGLLRPGRGPATHRHQRYDEAFYVLEGEIEYCIGDEWITVREGTCVFAPAGLTHGFRNSSPSDARQLIIAAPAEAVELVEALQSVTADQLGAVLERYATEFVHAG